MKLEDLWEYRGQKRPDFAVTPGAGQESVWDYPRPPRIAADWRRVEVKSAGVLIASTNNRFGAISDVTAGDRSWPAG